ncbi:MAG: SDR family oxidoreductase [Clostridia bacterium]|nr:SDR family oxidoreductase [Clostridia bacterium]
MNLKNKVAVITGAGGVLCSAFAENLASLGCSVALLDINEEAVKEVAEKIKKQGGVAEFYSCSVLDKEQVEKVHKSILNTLGRCDILINGAGGNNPRCTTAHEYYEAGDEERNDIKTFFNLDKEGFDFVFSLNLMGTLIPTQVFSVDMLNRDGCIINISSMNAFTPLTKIPAYSSAKAAVSNFTQWLSVHFAKAGIRVNAIAPGFFVTKQNKDLLFNADGTPTQRTNKILNATPMGRFGKPEELFGALNFLCDKSASGFVTGVVIPVDGGFSAYSGV